MRIWNALRRFVRDESGLSSVEYAVLAGFVVLACAAGVAAFKAPAGSAFESSGTSIGTLSDP